MSVILETTNVTKTFKLPHQKPIEVLRGVNLSIHRGEKVAIIGRSGAGKSTLLNVLGGLLKPTSGTVKRPDNFGFVFQAYHLMPELTVLENVLLPCMRTSRWLRDRNKYKKRAQELLESVSLGARMEHLPQELSGGEQQRVALARALVTKPELVLADEPTGNLDEMTGAEILNILSSLSKGDETALVMVTHSLAAANVCDRTYRLSDGILI
jgi:ABC-type lipoprotein export system ATPase subunit